MEHETEQRFLDWLTKIKKRFPESAHCRISVMREAGGINHDEADAQTVSAQWEFPSMQDVKIWQRGGFQELMAECDKCFGQSVMTFTSVFETLE